MSSTDCAGGNKGAAADASGPDAQASDPGETGGGETLPDAAPPTFVAVVPLGANSGCLPSSLPRADAGGARTSCRVDVKGLGDCAHAGLLAARSGDVSAIDTSAQSGMALPPGPVCELEQEDAAGPNAGCQDAATPGWCYAAGSCVAGAAACSQALCVTTAFGSTYGSGAGDAGTASWLAWLVCP